MMILSLRSGRAKETDHAVRVKDRSRSPQGTFRQTSFLRSFCWWHAK
jgi:hypothetical protein